MRRRRFLQITAAALVARPAMAAEWRGTALGADAQITVSGPGADAALRDVSALLDRIEATFSLYRDSELARLNASGVAVPSDWMARALALCDRIHRATGGVFDPTVQPLWRALAEDRDPNAAQAAVGWHRILLDETVQLAPGQALTLNGMAQGFGADLVRDWLAARGFGQALVNLGEYAALGGPFRIGLADGGDTTLRGTALAVSEPGALRLAGQSHILHPAGAAPLWSLVAVEADSAALADGLSTALVFATVDEARAIRADLGGLHRIWLGDATGLVQV